MYNLQTCLSYSQYKKVGNSKLEEVHIEINIFKFCILKRILIMDSSTYKKLFFFFIPLVPSYVSFVFLYWCSLQKKQKKK